MENARSDGDWEAGYERLRADTDRQFEPPVPEPVTLPDIPPPRSPFSIPAWLADALVYALYAVIAVAGIYLMVVVVRRLLSLRREAGPDDLSEAPAVERVDTARARDWLARADELAGEGAYGDAIQHLLYKCLDHIASRMRTTLPPAWTAREVLSEAALPTVPRSALDRIVRDTERAAFAHQPLGAADWAGCRSAFETFADGTSWT